MLMRTNVVLLKIAALSFVLLLLTFWTALYGFGLASGVEAVCFMLLTWYCCRRYSSADLSCTQIVVAVVVGRFLLDLVNRIVNPVDTIVSLPVSVACLLGVFMGVLCHKRNALWAWIVSLLLLVGFSFVVPDLWFDYWMSTLKPLLKP